AFSARFSRRSVQRRNRSSPYSFAKPALLCPPRVRIPQLDRNSSILGQRRASQSYSRLVRTIRTVASAIIAVVTAGFEFLHSLSKPLVPFRPTLRTQSI